MRRSVRVVDNTTAGVKEETKAVDEDGYDADKGLPTEAALKCKHRPYNLDEAKECLRTMTGEYLKAGGFLTPHQRAAYHKYKYTDFIRKRAASKWKIKEEYHHVVPEHRIEGKRSNEGFAVLVTKSEHIYMHELLATFMPYNTIAKSVYAWMSGGSGGYRLMGSQGGRKSKGVAKTGAGAKGVPKTGGAAKGGVKDSKHAFRFNATCMDCKKRVFASAEQHRCLDSRKVKNSAKRLVLDV